MNILYCWACGTSYKKGAVQFCPNCGRPLSERHDLLDEINALKNQPVQYKLLRLFSGLFTILGIVLIVFSVVAAPLAYADISQAVSQIPGQSVDISKSLAFWMTVPIFSATFFFGVGWIALAQIIQILVSTFDQTKETSRLMRRWAMMLSEEK